MDGEFVSKLAIGIDLGTTYSAVAIVRPGEDKPEILLNREGENITPSVVYFPPADEGDQPSVGTAAKRMAGIAPKDVCQFIKGQIGQKGKTFESTNGTVYTPEEVDAIILKRLVEDAGIAMGEKITDVIVSVPAYFGDPQRNATEQAANIAGLNFLGLINEPTAAAIAISLEDDLEGTVMVYDLGGGTFDVTVLKAGKDKSTGKRDFDVVATAGDHQLGGFDFDTAIIEFAIDQIGKAGGPKIDMQDMTVIPALREGAEGAKRALTTVPKTTLHVAAGGKTYPVPLTVEDFEKATAKLLKRTVWLVNDVLKEANLGWADIDHVLLVGGSTKMRMVPALIERLRGMPATRTRVSPDEAVALGAAVKAAQLGDNSQTRSLPEPIEIHDVTSQAMGLIALDNGRDRTNFTIIPKNSKIPCQYSDEYGTVRDHQHSVLIEVTEGESADPDFVTVITSKSVPIPDYPRDAQFRVTYMYDIDQIIQVQVEDLTTGKVISTFEVERKANLSEDDVSDAIQKVRGLDVE